jgi:hypothetical protein
MGHEHVYWVSFPQGIRRHGTLSDGQSYCSHSNLMIVHSIKDALETMEKYNAPYFEKLVVKHNKRYLVYTEYNPKCELRTYNEIWDTWEKLPEIELAVDE